MTDYRCCVRVGKRSRLGHVYVLWVAQKGVGGSHLVQSKQLRRLPPQRVR